MKIYYVYILKCSDGTYYTGITSNLEQRLTDHQAGRNRDSYTYSRRPVVLKYYAEFTDVSRAIQTEKQIKKWSNIKKKALIQGEFDNLTDLAKKKFDNQSL